MQTNCSAEIGRTHIILRRNLSMKVFTNEGNLLQNIVSDLGNLAEEENREDSGGNAEGGGGYATNMGGRISDGVVRGFRTEGREGSGERGGEGRERG